MEVRESFDGIMNFTFTFIFILVTAVGLGILIVLVDKGIHDRFDTLDARLDTIRETVTTIQNTLQDSTLLLKKKYHNGNVYIDLWQGEDLMK